LQKLLRPFDAAGNLGSVGVFNHGQSWAEWPCLILGSGPNPQQRGGLGRDYEGHVRFQVAAVVSLSFPWVDAQSPPALLEAKMRMQLVRRTCERWFDAGAHATGRQRLRMNVGTITSVSQATPFCMMRGKAFLILAIDRFCEVMQEEP
jgi:hypothetical protein